MKYYFINGWRENRNYFMSIGNFTERDMEYMEKTGEEITRGGNTFRIEVTEI